MTPNWTVPPMDLEKPHDCLSHLVPLTHEWIEPTGEQCCETRWQCVECGEEFTDAEVDRLQATREELERLHGLYVQR